MLNPALRKERMSVGNQAINAQAHTRHVKNVASLAPVALSPAVTAA
ncbi:hypothetical protein [Hafnia alvei]|nr:hypothetical protein [Hafnia alvei]MDU7483679.1 hypothetical protein [Hafnia alvei]